MQKVKKRNRGVRVSDTCLIGDLGDNGEGGRGAIVKEMMPDYFPKFLKQKFSDWGHTSPEWDK